MKWWFCVINMFFHVTNHPILGVINPLFVTPLHFLCDQSILCVINPFHAGVGKVQCASLTAAAEVGMALESEAVASAVREADFERMQREAAEAGVASLQDASEKLKQKLKTAQVNLHQQGLLYACLFGCTACTRVLSTWTDR